MTVQLLSGLSLASQLFLSLVRFMASLSDFQSYRASFSTENPTLDPILPAPWKDLAVLERNSTPFTAADIDFNLIKTKKR
jgi:hypothetical protein